MFADIMAKFRQCGGLDAMRCLGDHLLNALDGTEYHCSDKIHCPNCSHRKRGKGKIEYFHSMLAAAVVAPGHNHAVPLEPEFILPQDGHEKQDCESRAVRRWLSKHGARYAALNPVYLGDDLMSRQPICQAVQATGGHFLFVCEPDSHPAIEEFRQGIKPEELVRRVRRGKQWMTYRYQWLCGVPLRGDAAAIDVNRLSIEIRTDKGDVTYRNSFITDLPVHRDNVVELAAGGRARWKVENETFNTLKTKGYNLEHNFGHGRCSSTWRRVSGAATGGVTTGASSPMGPSVDPGKKLSLQKHFHRAEHWGVVQGTARVVRDSETIIVGEAQHIHLRLGCAHRLEDLYGR